MKQLKLKNCSPQSVNLMKKTNNCDHDNFKQIENN